MLALSIFRSCLASLYYGTKEKIVTPSILGWRDRIGVDVYDVFGRASPQLRLRLLWRSLTKLFLYEEPFSVKNIGGRAILEESQIMAPPKRLQLLRRSPSGGVLPNTPLLATHILFGMLNFSFAVAHM
jgi:hypothetical protein